MSIIDCVHQPRTELYFDHFSKDSNKTFIYAWKALSDNSWMLIWMPLATPSSSVVPSDYARELSHYINRNH